MRPPLAPGGRRLVGPALVLAAAAAYAIVRPGVLPWLLLVGAVALALDLAYRRPPSVTVERELDSARAFAGGRVEVRLRLTVRAALPTLLTLEESPPRTLIPDRPAALTGLFWGKSSHELGYEVRPNRRGAFAWPGPSLNWSDPLGLFVREVPLPPLATHEGRELLVYPGAHPVLLPDLARPLLADGPPSRARALEDPATITGAREYAPGDPLNRIHWRQTARHGLNDDGRLRRIIVRELESVAATGVHVHLDLDAPGRQGEVYLESAVRLGASTLRAAFDAGLRVSASSRDGATAPGASFPALERALAYLALARLEPGGPHEVPVPPAGTNLVLVTFAAPTDLVEGAIRARARAARVLVVAMPEGFYLEPGESPRPVFVSPPDAVRALERRAGVLAEAGVRVHVLRGDESVLKLAST